MTEPNWIEWRIATPGPGRKFIVAHDDGCSSGIYVMLDDGPHNAEDGENYGMDNGALWTLLPDNYPVRFMEVTEADWL